MFQNNIGDDSDLKKNKINKNLVNNNKKHYICKQ